MQLFRHGSATAALTGKGNDENNARQNEFSSSAFALASSWDFPLLEPCRAYADTVRGFHLVGRRLVDAYAISGGTLERQQLIKFTVEGKKINKLGAASPFSSSLSLFKDESSAKKTARKKKVFTGGRIFFDTINTSRSGTSDSCARGRIDNNLCDFLLPLLECDLIVLSGHIAYDCGKARTMVTIPISMHVMVSDEFLELSQECEDKTVLEAANDLMIWITEGDQALAQSRQQRESEVNPHFKKDGSKSVSDDIAEEVNTEVNEEGLTMSEADLGPVEMSVDEIVQPVKAELPLASQPSLMSPEIQMKDYQLQALFWMKGREVIKPEADSEDEQVSPTNDSKDSIVADTKVIVLEDSNDGNCCTEVHSLSRCESQRLSCPHNGVLEFPKNWGTQKREMNPLWQPVAALCMIWLRNLERSSSTHLFSPQSVPEIVPKVAAKDWTVFWWDRYSLKFQKQPPLAPKQCNGGLLADEMGLGKLSNT